MLRILYDHQIFSTQVYGGASLYFTELIKRLEVVPEIQVNISLFLTNNAYVKALRSARCINVPFATTSGAATNMLLRCNKIISVQTLARREFTVLHPTYYDPYFLTRIGSRPFVVTVFDMIHERFPEMFDKELQAVRWKREVLPKAARVITISESTRNDLLKYYTLDEKKIEVIHLASSLKSPSASTRSIRLPERFVLFVGQRAIYKNFASFIDAIAPILRTQRDVAVVCAGGGSFTTSELARLEALDLRNRVIHRQPTIDEMAFLYAKAICFVFPTLYEGFGLPVLEAFSCRCPVVASATSSIGEIGGDAILYFDPYSQESMRDAIAKAINDPDLRKRLVAAGVEQAARFSWEKTAMCTRKVYSSIV